MLTRFILLPVAGCLLLGSHFASLLPGQTEPTVGLRSNPAAVHALINARIVTGTGVVIDNGMLLIRDGRIEQFGANLSVPADARQWDLKGRSIYPGLIDLYTSVGLQDLTGAETAGAAFWNRQVRAELDAANVYIGNAEQAANLRSQGITVAMLAPRSGVFRGQTAIVSLNKGTPREQLLNHSGAASSAGVLQTIGFSRTAALGGGYPTSGMGTIALIRQVLLDAQWYGKAHQVYTGNPTGIARPERNDSLAALQGVVAGTQPVLFDTRDEQELLRALKIVKEFSLQPWIHGNGSEYRIVDQLQGLAVPLILPVNFPGKPDVTHPEASQQVSLTQLRHWKLAPENPGRLAQAGIKFALTSEQSERDFLRNVRTAVKRGLDADLALAAMTRYPAELLGLEQTHGTIQIGKVANLVVCDGDLLTGDGPIHDVWVDGERFEIYAPSPINPVGKWQVTAAEAALNGELTIQQRGSRWSGRWQGAVLESINYLDQAGRLRFLVPGQPLGQDGKIRASASVSADQMQGWCELPDGRQIAWTAVRQAQSNQDNNEESEKGDEQNEDEETGEKGDSDSDRPNEEANPPAADNTEAGSDAPASDPTAADPASAAPSQNRKEGTARLVRPFSDFGRTELPLQAEWLFIRNATIWTMGPQGVMENANLLVHRGKVSAVGKDLAIPSGEVLVIDAAGKHVTPGLIDAHLHSGVSGGVNEMGHAIVPEVRIGDVLDINTDWTYRQLAGGLTSAHVMHGSANPIGGQNQTLKLRWGCLPEKLKIDDAPRTVKFALGENVIRRVGRYPDTRMGVEQIIRDNFQAALDYQQRWADWQANPQGIPPRRNLQLEALAEIVRGDILIQTHCYRQDEVLMLIRLAEEFNAKIDVFHHTVEGYRVAPELKAHGAAAVVWSDWSSFKIESANATTFNARLLMQAGVVTSLHSDDSQIATRMNWEAAKMLRTGMTDEQALSLVTINTAKVIGVDHRIGSLEPGKDADFVIWSDHPLSNKTKAEQTWIDGARYFDLTEDRRLRAEIAEERNQLIQEILSN